jgi:hypothetical protein
MMLKLKSHASITWGSCYKADFDMVDLGWGLRFFFSNKFPGDADVARPRTMLE